MFPFNPLKDPKLAWEQTSGNQGTNLPQSEIKSRLVRYNRFHEDTHLQLKVTEENTTLDFEGPLRIYWGVKNPIHFQKLDETSINKEPKRWRQSYCAAIANGLEGELTKSDSMDSNDGIVKSDEETQLQHNGNDNSHQFRYNTIGGSEVAMRRKRVNKRVRRRMSMINGHLYDLEVQSWMSANKLKLNPAKTEFILFGSKVEHDKLKECFPVDILCSQLCPADKTSIFTPIEGSVTSVHICSKDITPAVIKLLLHKFKVENNPEEFCLCAVKKSGEVRVLSDTDSPLFTRVLMGPLEEEAKIWLRDRSKVKPISDEVAQYLALPEPVLIHFLQKLEEDQLIEKQQIIRKFEKLRRIIQKKLAEVETPEWNMD